MLSLENDADDTDGLCSVCDATHFEIAKTCYASRVPFNWIQFCHFHHFTLSLFLLLSSILELHVLCCHSQASMLDSLVVAVISYAFCVKHTFSLILSLKSGRFQIMTIPAECNAVD